MNQNETNQDAPLQDEVEIEEYAKRGERPPRARRYRIRIDRERFLVTAPTMTGRELLKLAGKVPPERFTIAQRVRGAVHAVGLDETVDFTAPGVERFMTLPLDQTEG